MQRYFCQINATTFPTYFPPAGKINNLASILNLLLPLAIAGVLLIFLAVMLYGAFTWITAGDNPENIKKAHNTILYSVLGLVIVIISYVLVKIIAIILNIQLPL